MPYVFKADISKEEFNKYIKDFSNASIMQTTAWADLKSDGWKSVYCGIFNDDDICGCCLLLIKKMPLGFNMGYCPRGPVFNLKDKELVEVFSKGIKEYAKSKNIYSIKIDPQIIEGLSLPELAEGSYYNPFEIDKESFGNLTSCGFVHKGFSKDLHEYIQPRYNAFVPLRKNEEEPLSYDELKKNCRSSIRKFIGGFQKSHGIFLDSPEINSETLDEFVSFIKMTEEKQGIHLRDREYFVRITQAFGKDAKIFFAKCDLSVYMECLKTRINAKGEDPEIVKKKMEEVKELISHRGNVVTLAAMLFIMPPNVKGIKVAEYLYAGSDASFKAFNVTVHSALFDAMRYCIEKNCDFVNFGGVAGDFNDGLYQFKARFNPVFIEYAGEFDLIVLPLKYKLSEKYLPKAITLYKKIVRLFKKNK